MPVTIRDATPDDASVIAHFNQRLAGETENIELDTEIISAGVKALLEDPSKGRYWLAEIDNTAVGQLMVTYEWSDWRNGMLWWIQSVYVHEDYRRHGVFTQLYRHVETLSNSRTDIAGIRLYVEKDNRRAQQTYESLGMSATGYLVMESLRQGDDIC